MRKQQLLEKKKNSDVPKQMIDIKHRKLAAGHKSKLKLLTMSEIETYREKEGKNFFFSFSTGGMVE